MKTLKNSKKVSYAILSAILFLTAMFVMVSYNNLNREEIRAATWADSGIRATSFAGGSGTASAPYQIETPQQMGYFAYRINVGLGRTSHYILKANISLSGYDWESIGTKTYYFSGHFDGDGHHITNLQGKNGLFGYTNSGSIKNLFLSGKIDTEGAADVEIGGLVGYSYSTNIEKISTDFKIISDVGSYWVGGVVGKQYGGSLKNISNSGSIIYTAHYTNDQNHHIGGLIGTASSTSLENVINYGNVTISVYSAGTRVYLMGGIIGWSSNSSLIRAINYGEVSSGTLAEAIVGGIVGNPIAGESAKAFTDLMNFGKVVGSSTNQYVGGIFGRVEKNTSISSVINRAEVKGKNNVGGIIGYWVGKNNISLSYAYNHGAVTGTGNNVGGIVGNIRDETQAKLENVSNHATIIGQNNVGGILGYVLTGWYVENFSTNNRGKIIINNAHNSGIIRATSHIAGGIAGRIDGYEAKEWYEGGWFGIGKGWRTQDRGANVEMSRLFNEGEIRSFLFYDGNYNSQSTAAFIGYMAARSITINKGFNVGNVWQTDYSSGSPLQTQNNYGNIYFGLNWDNLDVRDIFEYYYNTNTRYKVTNMFGLNRSQYDYIIQLDHHAPAYYITPNEYLFKRGASTTNGGLSYIIKESGSRRVFDIFHPNAWTFGVIGIGYTEYFEGFKATALDSRFTSSGFSFNNTNLYGGKFYLTAFYW